MNTLCGQNVGFMNVKYSGGTYSDHCAVHIVTTGLDEFKEAFIIACMLRSSG